MPMKTYKNTVLNGWCTEGQPRTSEIISRVFFKFNRFLACHKSKSGVLFTPEETDLYSKSWDKSCDTTRKLFDYVTKLQPHDTKKTLSLNEARNCIIAMSKPMGEAVQLIEMNLKKIKDVKDQCKIYDADIQRFEAELKFKGFERKICQLDYPMTVCAGDKCKRYVNVGKSRERETIYPTICHDHCHLSGVPVETTNNDQLYHCDAMTDGNCDNCDCNYRFHMHITYTTTLEEKEFLSDDAQRKINEKSSMKGKKQAFIDELTKRIKEYEEEKKFIFECASHFGVFLKENALIPFNDSFSEYLDMLIHDEEAKEVAIRDYRRIVQLRKDKETYEERKRIIEDNIKSSSAGKRIQTFIPIETINEMREDLCSLKHNGRTLREALDGIISARKRRHKAKRPKGYVEATNNNYWDMGIAMLQRLNPFGGTRRPASRPLAAYPAPLALPGRVEESKSLRPYRYK